MQFIFPDMLPFWAMPRSFFGMAGKKRKQGGGTGKRCIADCPAGRFAGGWKRGKQKAKKLHKKRGASAIPLHKLTNL